MEQFRSDRFISQPGEVIYTPPPPPDTEPVSRTKKNKSDGQMSGLAGEFFVAAELLKRGVQASVTFGNAKAIDLFAYNERNGRRFTIQVKSLRKSNYFLINPEAVQADHIYVFVLLNDPGCAVNYFIVPGKILRDSNEDFGNSFKVQKMPGILPNRLKKFEENWSVFDETV